MVPRPLQKLGGDSPLVSKADPIFKTLDESPRTTSIPCGASDGSGISSGSSIIHV